MAIFDKTKGNEIEPDEGLRSTDTSAPGADSRPRQTRQNDAGFRGRENPDSLELENEGLPSVNRRRGTNKLVTVLGFIFIIGAAMAMLIAVNSPKDVKKKNVVRDEKVANNLPPLVIPAPAPPTPIDFAGAQPLQGAVVPPVAPGTGEARPIPLYGGSNRRPVGTSDGKPAMTWQDRKLGGSLLVSKNGLSVGENNPVSRLNAGNSDEGTTPAFAGDRGQSESTNELGSMLKPTVTKSVGASLLSDRNFLITKGTSLDCALETALDSTVPGLTTCRLTRDVYSDNGQVLLLDRGSQLVGEYQGGLKQGQVRIFVLWTRAKTPNGVVVSLNSPGTDALGRSGLEGWVDNHFMKRFGAAILLSLVNKTLPALINQRANSNEGTTNIYGDVSSGGEKIVEKILESTVNIPPTIIKNQGDHIQVMVARDLDFSSVYALRVKQ